MEETRRYLRLVDDPVARTLWMLENMPIERVAAYLGLVAGQAGRLGLLSSQDQARIASLLARIPSASTDRAA